MWSLWCVGINASLSSPHKGVETTAGRQHEATDKARKGMASRLENRAGQAPGQPTTPLSVPSMRATMRRWVPNSSGPLEPPSLAAFEFFVTTRGCAQSRAADFRSSRNAEICLPAVPFGKGGQALTVTAPPSTHARCRGVVEVGGDVSRRLPHRTFRPVTCWVGSLRTCCPASTTHCQHRKGRALPRAIHITRTTAASAASSLFTHLLAWSRLIWPAE